MQLQDVEFSENLKKNTEGTKNPHEGPADKKKLPTRYEREKKTLIVKPCYLVDLHSVEKTLITNIIGRSFSGSAPILRINLNLSLYCIARLTLAIKSGISLLDSTVLLSADLP